MLAELGYLSLLLATGLALLQGLLPWLGLRLASRPLLGCATPLAILVAPKKKKQDDQEDKPAPSAPPDQKVEDLFSDRGHL